MRDVWSSVAVIAFLMAEVATALAGAAAWGIVGALMVLLGPLGSLLVWLLTGKSVPVWLLVIAMASAWLADRQPKHS